MKILQYKKGGKLNNNLLKLHASKCNSIILICCLSLNKMPKQQLTMIFDFLTF